jgi:transcriptional regulator with XRE-family HTH domain
MTGHHPFAELRAKMSPEARVRAEEKAKELRQEIDLASLRQALKLSQQQLAKKMRVNQPEIAKIEKRTDMLLSTLSGVLRAMGAELKIVASFPGHDIQIRSLAPRTRSRQIAARRSFASLRMTEGAGAAQDDG